MANPPRNPRWALPSLLGVFLFALLIRGLGFEHVFTDEGVVFAPADAMYHMRLSFYSFVNFPSPLLFDPYLNYPDGVAVPWSPLFDLIVGGVAKVFARDQAGFEVVGAWAASVFGALTVVPIYFIGRRVSTVGIGLGAGLLFSLFPVCVKYAKVGNPDHHSAVGLIGASLLLLCIQLTRRDLSDLKISLLLPWMILGRLMMFMMWHGSLLYIFFFEGTILLIAAATGRRSVIWVECMSALATGLILSPIVEEILPVPIGGIYSSISISRLHVLAMTGTAFVAGSLWLFQKTRHENSFGLRIGCISAAAFCFVLFLFFFPPTKSGLEPAFRFMTMDDGVGMKTLEQLPLFAGFGRNPVHPAEGSWAYFAYLIPIAPIALLIWVRDPEPRRAAFVVAGWCAIFGALTMTQRRYGNDLAPAASIAFALLLAHLPRAALARVRLSETISRRLAAGTTFALALLLLSPTLLGYEWPRLRSGVAALRGEEVHADKGMELISQNVSRFARSVRRATPDTDGFLNSRRVPEYGILANANIGHVLHYVARRATATDPMWSYIGPENWDRSAAFFQEESEGRALEIAASLGARYLVTSGMAPLKSIAGRLHNIDGRLSNLGTRIEHFRLVTESAPGRLGFGVLLPANYQKRNRTDTAFKLFEIVKGALLEIEAAPGESVSIQLPLSTARGRHFQYTAATTVGSTGYIRVRVPYATEAGETVRALEPYRIRVGTRELRQAVSEEQIRAGSRIVVGPERES